MVTARDLYDPTYDAWPDLRLGRVVLAPVRVGMDRRTGRMITGWKHVEQSMEVIFKTRFHERVLRRWVGSFVPHLLGESGTERRVTRFYWAIMVSIELWEPNYRLQRVRIKDREDGSQLTSVEELRLGHLSTVNEGVYRPRAHLGDPTPAQRRSVGLVGMGGGLWEVSSR
jgi:uncharacterized protein